MKKDRDELRSKKSAMFRRYTALCGAKLGFWLFASALIMCQVASGSLSLGWGLLLMLLMAALVLLFELWGGRVFFKKLELLLKGINDLSRGEPVHLYEEGIASELAESLNRASELQTEQKLRLEKRDDLRIEWIRGVSHDIRTPLSLVMGCAEDLEEDGSLETEQRRLASQIKLESIRIKELIDDLNLLSRLEYDDHPLRLTKQNLAGIIRNVAAELMDRRMQAEQEDEAMEHYGMELMILPEFGGLELSLDQSLIRRVLQNIIGNSVRHNPEGCDIIIFAHKNGDRAIIDISDDGVGIPRKVADCVNSYGSELQEEEDGYTMDSEADGAESLKQTAGLPHIMGMRIAKRIMLSHGGNMLVRPDLHTVSLIFRI